MPTQTKLPAADRLARNIGEGYEILLGKNQTDGSEAWGLVVDVLEVVSPAAFVTFTVEYGGKRVTLPAVRPDGRLMSRRGAR